MQRKTTVVLRKTTLTTMVVIFFLAMLPGCAVVGPLLSIGSMIGTAPLQYASAAYTVGEYTYEYAANDKDPSEVIEAKILSVLSGDILTVPDANGKEAPDDKVMVAEAKPETKAQAVEAAISAQARQNRIDQLLGRRDLQFERLELRRMAFLKAKSDGELTLRQTAMATSPTLFKGAVGETTLR